MRRTGASTALIALLCGMVGLLAFGQPYAEATSYDIRMALDTDRDVFQATQTVQYVNPTDEPVDELVFFLMANWGAEENPYLHPSLNEAGYARGFDPTWTRVSSVTDPEGMPLSTRYAPTPPFLQTYSLENGLLFVSLPTPLQPGEQGTLQMAFETKFARGALGDQCLTAGIYIWRFGWNPIAVGPGIFDGENLLPSAHYLVELTLRASLNAYGGADVQEVVAEDENTRIVRWQSDRPVRSVPLVIGPTLQAVSLTVDGVRLESVYRAGGESFARWALTHAAETMELFSARYGAFPGTRVVIAESPSPGLFGMAADGMILLGADAVHMKDMPALGAYDRINEYLIAHELAHLWWGIGIGADFNAENWISEGFAEYMSISLFEERYGAFTPNLLAHLQPGLVENLLSSLFGPLNLRQHLSEMSYLALLKSEFDEPIVQPLADSDAVNGLAIRTYSKGYLVLRALEAILGEEDMQRFLLAAHREWVGRVTTVEALQALAEQASGQDLSLFFDDWVRGIAQSDAAVHGLRSVPGDGTYAVEIDITAPHPAFPLVVQAELEDGTTVRRTLDPGCCDGPVLWETASRVVSITVDPDERLPDINRFNNHWPRKIRITHPFDSGDGLSMIYPLDAYVIDISMFGVSGGFRTDHAWAVQILPSLGSDVALDALAMFQATIGRSDLFMASASFTGLNVSGGTGRIDIELTAERVGFSHPDVGVAGKVWYPQWRNRITLGATGEISDPTAYIAWTAVRDDTPSLFMTQALQLRLGLPGFGRETFGTVRWVGQKRFHLAPQTYLDLTGAADEVLFGVLPRAFLFSLSAMHSFPYLPMGHHQRFVSVDLVLPSYRPSPGYALLNLTRLSAVTPSLFVQGGITEADCEVVCEGETLIEVGAKIRLRLPLFLGEAVSVALGYAWPLVGPEGEPRLFLEWGAGGW